MISYYSLDDFEIVPFKSMNSGSDRFLSAKNWILSMTDLQDNEHGHDFWLWIEQNNELARNDRTHLLNTWFMFLRNDPHVVIATGSLVKDDRNMTRKLALKDVLWIGGVNVHREHRGRSIGTILIGFIDRYIRQTITQDVSVYLFTTNQQAKQIYQRYGFQSKGLIPRGTVDHEDEENELFAKFYSIADVSEKQQHTCRLLHP